MNKNRYYRVLLASFMAMMLFLLSACGGKTDAGKKGGSDEALVTRPSNRDRTSDNKKTESDVKDGGHGIGIDPEANKPAVTGASFAGDWEGITLISDASGSHAGLEVSDDWIFATYARIYAADDHGDVQMDMVGVMRNEPLNYTISKAGYNPDTDKLGVDGMVAGGNFHAILSAPGDNGVLKLEGRTSGDIEASYVCYLKRLDSDWERSDAINIPDREYIMYVENNMPLDRGLTLEERVEAAAQAGIVVDMSGFLPPESGQNNHVTGGDADTANNTEAANNGSDGAYSNDGKDFAIKTEDLPSNYPPVSYDRFVEGYKAIVDGEISTSSSYEDVAKAFGDDGIRMNGIVYSGYAYYGWYADKDYLSDTKVHVLVTFKESGGKLTYYANSAVGITPQDVK